MSSGEFALNLLASIVGAYLGVAIYWGIRSWFEERKK